MKTTPLWTVTVGSHMWQMNHAGSDEDLFSCYAVDTRSILRGEVRGGEAAFTSTEAVDVQNHEVQKWVEMLLKGNLNYVTAIFSPLVRLEEWKLGERFWPEGFHDPSWLAQLREIARRGMAKNIHGSLKGMTMGNVERYEPGGRGYETPELVQKKFRACLRVLKFGTRWMDGEGPSFEPIRGEYTKEDVMREVAVFDLATEQSKLPEKPTNEEEYRDFLYRVRMAYL